MSTIIQILIPMKTKEEIKSKYGQGVELRFMPNVEARADEEGNISGYAAVFNSWSPDYYGWRERIAPAAFDGVDMKDVVVTFNHNFDNILARTGNGSAKLSVDERGLKYEFKAPNTSLGRDMAELIRTQTVAGSSFMFTVEDEDWQERGESYDRTITKIGKLYELGPVSTPWYPDTTADLKQMQERMRAAGINLEETKEEQDTDKTEEPKGYDPTLDLLKIDLI